MIIASISGRIIYDQKFVWFISAENNDQLLRIDMNGKYTQNKPSENTLKNTIIKLLMELEKRVVLENIISHVQIDLNM